jgi:hypothetical protein
VQRFYGEFGWKWKVFVKEVKQGYGDAEQQGWVGFPWRTASEGRPYKKDEADTAGFY